MADKVTKADSHQAWANIDSGNEAKTQEASSETNEHGVEWRDLGRILFVAVAAGIVWTLGLKPGLGFLITGLVCTLCGGYPIFREAIENILERRMTMELSMAIAILAALAIREVFTALVITLFVLVAEVLEGLTVGRGRQSIRHLINLLPSAATVNERGDWKEVGVAQLAIGDIVLIKPGHRIPVDGCVIEGHSFVDQATITGESMPVEKKPGSAVYAGTINQSGAFEVRVERLGLDTTFGRIIKVVEEAEKSRAPIQRIADRLAGYLVYFAFAAAILTFLITHNIRSTISVIIVAGACGIAAGTPLAILGAIGRAAQHGAIIKGGLYLERLGQVDTILLDKTGTLTFGTPELRDIHAASGVSPAFLLKMAAIAESRSEHPMAKAVLKKAKELRITAENPSEFEYTPGKGIAALWENETILVGSRSFLQEHGIEPTPEHADFTGSEVFVARQGKFLGALDVADTLRPEAKEAVQSLKAMRLRTILLTGDAKAAAEDIARKLGVDEFAAGLLPEDKMEYVKRLTESSRTVAMVGDGVNDAPALVQASVGVAVGSGTDVARESADVVLIGSDLSKLVETLQIARRCRRTIMQNFAGTLIVDSVGVCLAAFGFLNPLFAAFIHVSSELVFILNSARLVPKASLLGAFGADSPTSPRPTMSQIEPA